MGLLQNLGVGGNWFGRARWSLPAVSHSRAACAAGGSPPSTLAHARARAHAHTPNAHATHSTRGLGTVRVSGLRARGSRRRRGRRARLEKGGGGGGGALRAPPPLSAARPLARQFTHTLTAGACQSRRPGWRREPCLLRESGFGRERQKAGASDARTSLLGAKVVCVGASRAGSQAFGIGVDCCESVCRRAGDCAGPLFGWREGASARGCARVAFLRAPVCVSPNRPRRRLQAACDAF